MKVEILSTPWRRMGQS